VLSIAMLEGDNYHARRRVERERQEATEIIDAENRRITDRLQRVELELERLHHQLGLR